MVDVRKAKKDTKKEETKLEQLGENQDRKGIRSTEKGLVDGED